MASSNFKCRLRRFPRLSLYVCIATRAHSSLFCAAQKRFELLICGLFMLTNPVIYWLSMLHALLKFEKYRAHEQAPLVQTCKTDILYGCDITCTQARGLQRTPPRASGWLQEREAIMQVSAHRYGSACTSKTLMRM
eukprot:1156212-Pelagomonas_calceolata.AAC.3